MEPLAKETERYVFINVPYNFMFTCKARPRRSCAARHCKPHRSPSLTLLPGPAQIANPARLCAVFERAGAASA